MPTPRQTGAVASVCTRARTAAPTAADMNGFARDAIEGSSTSPIGRQGDRLERR
jgi:hypothetical protein